VKLDFIFSSEESGAKQKREQPRVAALQKPQGSQTAVALRYSS